MKGYDGIFLLNYLVRKKLLPQHIIFSGSKIMYMIVGKDLNIRVIGSFNHLPMSLLVSWPEVAKEGFVTT